MQEYIMITEPSSVNLNITDDSRDLYITMKQISIKDYSYSTTFTIKMKILSNSSRQSLKFA